MPKKDFFIKKSITFSFIIIIIIYTIAFFTGFFTVKLLYGAGEIYDAYGGIHLLLVFFVADIITTTVVWIFGIIFNNSSVYDPYWSVAPVAIIVSWIIIKQQTESLSNSNLSAIEILFLLAIVIWGMRLTVNWAIRWKGLNHQDWRYIMLKTRSPKMWFLTNLAGINMMPTIIVYFALTPAFFGVFNELFNRAEFLTVSLSRLNSERVLPSWITMAGFIICILSVVIAAISDIQLDNFRKKSKNHIDRGIWRYSRHPNYFGEVSFWWGIWLMQFGVAPNIWVTVIGPVLMTILFVFVSIPMMEKHIILSKPSYKDYKKRVSMLIPWFRFRQ